MRTQREPRAIAAALVAALACASTARAGETWIEADPDAGRLVRVWKEGALESGREGARPFARITTDGRGSPALVANATPYAPALDARGRFVKVLARVHGASELAGLELRLGSDGLRTHWFSLALPLYADPDYNLLQDGEWTSLTLGFGGAQREGTPDRAALDRVGLVVRDRGSGPVRLDVAGLALVDEPAEGVASFTFDDGYAEHLAAARLMAARGLRGTAYVIPSLVGRKGWMDLAGLRELARLGFDVAAHDDAPLTGRAPAELAPALRAVQRFLRTQGFGAGAAHFAYPLGKQEPRRVRPEVRRRFATARIAGGGPETLPPGDPHLLRAVNVTSDTTPEALGAAARRAREHKEWLILMFHHLVEAPAQPTEYALADFARALDAVARSGLRVAPVSAVWAELEESPERPVARPPAPEPASGAGPGGTRRSVPARSEPQPMGR
jgi:hypothetical protein